MILPSGRLQIGNSDAEVTSLLRAERGAGTYSIHFSQNEELFIRLGEPVDVPSFPVHHDLGDPNPHPDLARAVRSVAEQIHRADGEILGGLTHLFDPSSNGLPAFFRLYRMDDVTYLYLVRIDLTYRPRRSTLVERTTNAVTTHYRTRDLFIESDLFPLSRVDTENNRVHGMELEQAISDTWIGETGRGYMRAGMWLDRDLTKFFSRLFTPEGVQTYPYYPFTCKYRTVSHMVANLREEARRRSVQLLHRARKVLLPNLREIENSLRTVRQNGFAETLPAFVRLRRTIGDEWNRPWTDFSIRMYLNEEDEREYELEHGLV